MHEHTSDDASMMKKHTKRTDKETYTVQAQLTSQLHLLRLGSHAYFLFPQEDFAIVESYCRSILAREREFKVMFRNSQCFPYCVFCEIKINCICI